MKHLGPVAIAALLTIAVGLAAVKIADACNYYLDHQACLQSAAADGTPQPDSYCQAINR